MAHAEVCPVCSGEGKVLRSQEKRKSYSNGQEVCNGCGGCGWVTVQELPLFKE